MLKRIFKKRINEIYTKYKSEDILIVDDMTNFFGQESLGVWKIRGNGVLLLTKKELYFGMWKPEKEILIPVKSIVEIKNPKSHMHRSRFRPLLKITFKNETGEIDSVAWLVRNLNKWNNILNELISINM
ncbi:MAG: hypothetical protein ACFFAI_10190 [Promethearchaeota archaeon]